MATQHQPSRTAAALAAPTAAERRLSALLRALAGLFLLAAIGYAIGPFLGDFFREPPFVANSVVEASIVGLALLYASGDVRGRRELIALVLATQVAGVLAMGSMALFGETGAHVDLGLSTPTVGAILWNALALKAVITAVLGAFFVAARGPAAPARDEGGARAVLLPLAALLVLGAVAYEVAPFLDTTKEFARQLPFVANSVVKTLVLAALCFYAARRELALAGPVAAVHALSVLCSAAYLIFLDTSYSLPLLGGSLSMTTALWIALALDGAIAAGVTWASLAAWRKRYELDFFQPVEFNVLIALADVLVAGPQEPIAPRRVAENVERHVKEIRAHRRWVYRVVLFALELTPLLTLRPPLSQLEPYTRRAFLVKHFEHPPKWPRALKNGTQAMIRVGQQLSFVGYYSDPATFPSIGYKLFKDRPGAKVPPDPGPHPLDVRLPADVGERELKTEICIVGSGAGGGILAYELAAAGHDVLVIERGKYVEPRHFTDDEVGMIGKLYADGVMQQTQDFRFTVLQGSCVGGSTTVNNAVCFRTPEPVLERWNDPARHDAGLDLGELRASTDAIERFLTVQEQGPPAILNPSGERYIAGVRASGARLEAEPVRANIADCAGSGYCNIGCKWGRKLSMLETALPWAQARFPGRVRIVAECEVERLVELSGKPKRIQALRAKLSDGRGLTIKADRYVLAAGAVGSSYLMLRSGVGRGLPVGEHLCFNMGAPLTADLGDEPLNSYAGLQISHYGIPRDDRGYVFETWFNPPVSQALNMPGWFEDHYGNMRRYDRLMAVGVLVGTQGNAAVKKALTGGADISYRPAAEDLRTLARGLTALGRILFEAKARRVLLNAYKYYEFRDFASLERDLPRICADADDITLGTGHPQGGNALSRDPKRGVVDEEFRVHGYANLHVCDASVFPSSLTVNPQLTVMSLAHYAASRIA
jgi:choline dehydrogenase-like flavoprotein